MSNFKILLIILVSIGLALFLIKRSIPVPVDQTQNQEPIKLMTQSSSQSTNPQPSAQSAPKQFTKPETVIEPSKTYIATLHTSAGNIVIQLDTQTTPLTANNFVFLIQQGFYDQTIFHRIISGFMIQGGDPKGDGTGGPGYKFPDESFTGEYDRGTVAMANSGPNTNGSQFFIMHQSNPLPKNYVIFGHVLQGLEVVDAIAAAPVVSGPNGEKSQPISPVIINSASLEIN